MGASAYVGRVGGLAVALGVGAAVATGHGVAWATDTESNSPTSEHAASEGSPNANPPAPNPPADPSAVTSTPAATAETGDDASIDDAEADADADQIADDADADADDAVAGADPEAETHDAGDDAPDQTADHADIADESDVDPSGEPDDGPVTSNIEARTADVDDDTALTPDDADTGLQLSALAVESPTTQTQSLTTTVQHVVPVMMAAQQAPAAQPLLQRVVVNLLSNLGIGALASNVPGAPVWSPFVMALLGLGSRREFGQPLSALAKTVGSTPVAALALTDMATAAVTSFPGTTRKPVSVSTNTHWIEFVTGKGNLNNTTTRFGIGGTDLGIMWDNGMPDNPATTGVDEHQVLIAFGDTFSNTTPVRTGVWRFNTLFRTPDATLSNGLYVPDGIPVSHWPRRRSSPLQRLTDGEPELGGPDPAQPRPASPSPLCHRARGDDHPDGRHFGSLRQRLRRTAVHELHVRQVVGHPGPVDDELLGHRLLRRQRPKLAHRTDEHPHGRGWTGRPSRTSPATRTSSRARSSSRPPARRRRLQGWVYSYGTPRDARARPTCHGSNKTRSST